MPNLHKNNGAKTAQPLFLANNNMYTADNGTFQRNYSEASQPFLMAEELFLERKILRRHDQKALQSDRGYAENTGFNRCCNYVSAIMHFYRTIQGHYAPFIVESPF